MLSLLYLLAQYAVIVAVIASALWFFADYIRDQERLTADLERNRLELSQARASLTQAEEVTRVDRAYLQQTEAQAEHWEKLVNDLRS